MKELGYLEGNVRALTPDVEETRTIEFIISTGTRDRYRTVLNQDGWNLDNYNRNGIVGYQHNVYGDACNPPNPDDVIGAGRAWLEDTENGKALIGSVRFETADVNPLAEKVFRKVMAGTLRAASVGFQPIGEGRWGDGDEARGQPNETYYFEGQELLEWSIVNIPGNPEAVRRSFREHSARAMMFVRRALTDTTGEHYSFADIERLTVRDVLDLLDGIKPRSATPNQSEAASPPAGADTEATTHAVRAALQDLDLRSRLRHLADR